MLPLRMWMDTSRGATLQDLPMKREGRGGEWREGDREERRKGWEREREMEGGRERS